ncbi:uncharacterized protein EV420DRAFT_1275606 [Desarmillaria tabescens]|uniref:Uncharacterized protein n=1 Tax=Armillaria tabescens TaxID=1929756 RepID=A0AA39JUC4_ARMTA|nr:uncharacterized protein EV420DRAFT_1275606 [Desarmillaria tabescens]KAK0448943.1 hypothetical protein EV420DRAFT_1275606 [Desarmillaria tabescens]
MNTRLPYAGDYRKLLLAFDLGTTYSGISYSVLDPSLPPTIQPVTRYPSLEGTGSNAKIPTIICYDRNGRMRAAGAEAISENINDKIQEEGWVRCEKFKLHLRPPAKDVKSDNINQAISPLPPGKNVVTLFADFYAYLFECAKTFIQQTHPSGATFWSSVEDSIEFILSHPNGWEGAQQEQMRKAAVQGGLVSNDAKNTRVHFVTEGEASLHFCIQKGLSSHVKKGEGVIIVDAGGGTVDISSYTSVSAEGAAKYSFQEIAAPFCDFTGSIFVTQSARTHIDEKLKGSKYYDDVGHIAECFDKSTKLRFKDPEEPSFVKFGSLRDRDNARDIRSGQLKLKGSDVATFFEPSITSITKAIDAQRAASTKPVSAVFLVGGFAASDWLFLKVQEHTSSLGLTLARPDSHVNKAVADGAVSFHLDHAVTARVSPYNYGVTVCTAFDGLDMEHVSRRAQMFVDPSGVRRLAGQYDIILAKDVLVSEETEFSQSYCRIGRSLSDLSTITTSIWRYNGEREHPRWMDVENDKYSVLCRITADTSVAAKSLIAQRCSDGTYYYRLSIDVIMLFGMTELKAQLAWIENVSYMDYDFTRAAINDIFSSVLGRREEVILCFC